MYALLVVLLTKCRPIDRIKVGYNISMRGFIRYINMISLLQPDKLFCDTPQLVLLVGTAIIFSWQTSHMGCRSCSYRTQAIRVWMHSYPRLVSGTFIELPSNSPNQYLIGKLNTGKSTMNRILSKTTSHSADLLLASGFGSLIYAESPSRIWKHWLLDKASIFGYYSI